MDIGHFYYLNDQYYADFPDFQLMQNKEKVNGKPHDRPCFYAFKDNNTGLYWLIPISSRIDKYYALYNRKLSKYDKCDTIVFGSVLGHKKAFLIQNMCPTTENYIASEYIDRNAQTPVRINEKLEKELITKAKRVLSLQRRGINLIFPNVLKIEAELLTK